MPLQCAGLCVCAHASLYYHLVHMCAAVLCAFRLTRHVRENPHLGAGAAARLWPPKPWTHSQGNATQHRPVRTQQNRRGHRWWVGGGGGAVTASDQMVVRVCASFLGQRSLAGTAVSQSEVWWEFGGGMKGWGIEEWRRAGWGWRNNQVLTALVFFLLTEFIPMTIWGENISFSWLLRTFC